MDPWPPSSSPVHIRRKRHDSCVLATLIGTSPGGEKDLLQTRLGKEAHPTCTRPTAFVLQPHSIWTIFPMFPDLGEYLLSLTAVDAFATSPFPPAGSGIKARRLIDVMDDGI